MAVRYREFRVLGGRPLVTLVRIHTGANEFPMGLVVRRCSQCSAGWSKKVSSASASSKTFTIQLWVDWCRRRPRTPRSPLDVGAVLGQDDLVGRPAGAGVHALGQRIEDSGPLWMQYRTTIATEPRPVSWLLAEPPSGCSSTAHTGHTGSLQCLRAAHSAAAWVVQRCLYAQKQLCEAV
jgi:hypothetical protein